MAATVRAVTTTSGSGGTATINKPTGTAENDILLCIVHWNGPPSTNPTMSGFTNILSDREYNGPSAQVDIFYKVAGASEGSSYSITASSNRYAVTMLAIQDADTSTIWDIQPTATTENTGSGTVNETDSITTTTDGSLVVALFVNDSNSVSFSTTPNDVDSSWTTRSNLSGQQLLSVSTYDKTTAGSIGPVHCDQSTSNGTWLNNIFAILAGGSVETATVTPLSLTATLPSVTATHDEVRTASVSPIATTATLPSVTATYVQVETATVTPISTTLTVTTTTATYVQISTATVSPLATTITIPSVTAVGSSVATATVSPLVVNLTIVSITATYVQVETATVSPLATTLTVVSVTATHAEVRTATVSPLQTTLTVVSITATYSAVLSAVVSPLSLTLTPTTTVATFASVQEATVSPLALTLAVPSITATTPTQYNATVFPLELQITILETGSYGTIYVNHGGNTLGFGDIERSMSSRDNAPVTILSDVEPSLGDSDVSPEVILSSESPLLL